LEAGLEKERAQVERMKHQIFAEKVGPRAK
jgi:hypothetical protein